LPRKESRQNSDAEQRERGVRPQKEGVHPNPHNKQTNKRPNPEITQPQKIILFFCGKSTILIFMVLSYSPLLKGFFTLKGTKSMIIALTAILCVASVWTVLVVATQKCTDGTRVGRKLFLNPKIFRNTTVPTFLIITGISCVFTIFITLL
jgi:hypothetical protein